ncbi:peptidylprolyl isomerase [Thalassoglobus polymorphus]|uniref:peptidylprolyl isomerase n=1 Tax=Thalassoglobus polymorphus TaxID=2527994 RepID=A0A517QR88_9PLAN|nr:peptidyl-prolyl cis-trans isomerase [Thalassoglobus polymorphus]QDT34133.1 Foldase protein PrsA 2 precursor [Thalassoglobus polymorphus]
MSRIVILMAVILSVGCSQHRYDIADPVVGPPPPRKQGGQAVAYNSEAESEFQLASYTEDEIIPMTEVVARVNGNPILAGQVLEPYAAKLAQARKQMPASEIRKAQEMLLKKSLPTQIEQTLMVDAVKSKMTTEQYTQVDEQLDEFFAEEVVRLQTQFNVGNIAELETLLQSQGMSLATMRDAFGNRQLASEYVRGKMGSEAPLTRQDLLKEYNLRKEEFAHPEQIKWQQIQVSVTKHGSRNNAAREMNKAIEELRQGADFTDVVQRYSDGPLKDKGGHWDWTQPSSIANTDVRTALAKLQTGQMSEVIQNDSSLHIVKVTGRKAATYTPFPEVQEKIRTELIAKQREAKAEKILAELRENAVIETMFDDRDSTVK